MDITIRTFIVISKSFWLQEYFLWVFWGESRWGGGRGRHNNSTITTLNTLLWSLCNVFRIKTTTSFFSHKLCLYATNKQNKYYMHFALPKQCPLSPSLNTLNSLELLFLYPYLVGFLVGSAVGSSVGFIVGNRVGDTYEERRKSDDHKLHEKIRKPGKQHVTRVW